MRFLTDTVLNAVTTGSSVNSAAIDTTQIFAVSVMAVVATAGTGDLKLQASNEAPATGTPAHWVDIPSATVALADAGTYLIPRTEVTYRFVRVVFTSTTGGGTLTATLQAQAF